MMEMGYGELKLLSSEGMFKAAIFETNEVRSIAVSTDEVMYDSGEEANRWKEYSTSHDILYCISLPF